MKKIGMVFIFILSTQVMAQSTASDIPVNQLPSEVKTVLEEYVKILQNSSTLDDCAKSFTSVAGGSLVNESATNITLRSSVKDYGLKKDFENIKFYSVPLHITRVNSPTTKSTQGFGESAISGRIYKIWIGKIDSNNGLPAPVTILVPEGHATIKTPKVVNIGSF